ncbi:hypothetical protein BX68_15850 [Escherichia coli O177:NM str. 2010C-4558]|nr:hypothetical protein BX68_15850 [Escherichia coli O177:NM str. 2010C-4558]
MFALKIIWLSMIYVTPITKVIIAPATETYRLDFQRCQCNFISTALNIVSNVQAADALFDFFNQFFVGKSGHLTLL